MTPTLYQKYKKEVVPALSKEFKYKSIMQVPKITKVVLNVGYGRFLKEPNFAEFVEKTSPIFPVKNRFAPKPRNLFPILKPEKVWKSERP